MVELLQAMAAFFNVFMSSVFLDQNQQIDAETAHWRLQTEMGMDYTSIWKLINVLRKNQNARDSDKLRINTGVVGFAKKKTTKIQRSR